VIAFCGSSVLLLLGSDDRLTGTARVVLMWIYVGVFIAAAAQDSEDVKRLTTSPLHPTSHTSNHSLPVIEDIF
jgi:hypothetical protein